MQRRSIAWAKEPPDGLEWVDVGLRPDRLSARGVAVGGDPLPYRLDYDLRTTAAFVTARLRVQTSGEGWRRRLDLRRSRDGRWSADWSGRGEAPGVSAVDAAAFDADALAGALDCDLGLCPLTNTMPVLRHGLLRGGGPVDLAMAWVSVPDLAVIAAAQRYTFVRPASDGAIVRYASGSIEADITFDADGLVVDYPRLARRWP